MNIRTTHRHVFEQLTDFGGESRWPTLFKGRYLFWLLLFISVFGCILVLHGISVLVASPTAARDAIVYELVIVGLVITPWSIRLPSGASWRPGMPLMMMGIFMAPPSIAALIPIPSILLITARSRSRWWKYPQTIAHVSLGLYAGGLVYQAFVSHWHGFAAVPIAMFIALITHLLVNRSISAVIVAHRDGRPLYAQAILVWHELHWGYMNSYLLVLMTAMVERTYHAAVIILATIIQIGIFRTVSHYTKLEQLRRSALIDGLTHAENRASWDHFVNRVSATGTVAVIDFDHFKRINDQFGHLFGDEVLRDAARTILEFLPEQARLFRFGGDEFVVYSPTLTSDTLYNKLSAAIGSMSNMWKEKVVSIGASIGVAQSPDDAVQLTELFRIADARMYSEKQRQRLSVSDMEIGIPSDVMGLVLAIESRDIYIAGHSFRVAFYSLKLAQRMGLDSQQLKAIFRGGILHDVGKIGIPDSILKKPGQLSEEEMQIIRKHPEDGYKMCSKLGLSEEELEVILLHHERWDGTGYPKRLRDEEIPLLARITTVADIYDALTSSRSYREAWSHANAMRFITENTGTIFDPDCVNHWLTLNSPAPISEQYSQWRTEDKDVADVLSRVQSL